MNEQSAAELLDLLWALYDERLTPEQECLLERQLCRSATARQMYVRFIGIQGLLSWNIVPPDARPAVPAVISGPTSSGNPSSQAQTNRSLITGYLSQTIVSTLFSRSTLFWLVAIVTNALLVFTLAMVLSPKLRARLTGEPGMVAAARPAAPRPARLVSSRDGRWDPAGIQPAIGEELPSGPLRLIAGLVELEFADGARVSFLGPSDFDVLDSAQVHLEVGELRALVPQQAVGFRVLTPSAEVVDLGTEFGVRVSGLETFVHCVRGKVRMQPNSKSPQAPAPRQIVAGHSGSIDDNGWVEPKAMPLSPPSPADNAKVAPVAAASDQPEPAGDEVAAAQLINVQIAPSPLPAYEGSGVVKSGRTKWCVAPPAPEKPAVLHTASGAPSSAVCVIENATTCTTVYNASGDGLHDTYCFVSGDATGSLAISGLVPSETYDLYLFGTSGIAKGDAGAAGTGAPEGSLFTVGQVTKATSGLQGGDKLFTEGKDYVVFRAVRSDAQGIIRVAWTVNTRSNPPLNNNNFGPFNGLQIVGPIVGK